MPARNIAVRSGVIRVEPEAPTIDSDKIERIERTTRRAIRHCPIGQKIDHQSAARGSIGTRDADMPQVRDGRKATFYAHAKPGATGHRVAPGEDRSRRSPDTKRLPRATVQFVAIGSDDQRPCRVYGETKRDDAHPEPFNH